MKINIELDIDIGQLKKQIEAVTTSDIPEDSKNGLHNLLGTILDEIEKLLGECDHCGKVIDFLTNGFCRNIKGEWTDVCTECNDKIPEKDIDKSAEE